MLLTLTLWAGLALLLVPDDGPNPPRPADAPKAGPTVAEGYKTILAEYEAKQAALNIALGKAQGRAEEREVYRTLYPNTAAYCRRMVDLAASSIKEPGALDALIWVIHQGSNSDVGPFGDEFARAAALLVRHYGDDPEAVRVGLGLDNVFTIHRDALLHGFVASAKGREAKGLARLALGQYLARKAGFVEGAKMAYGRQKTRLGGYVEDDGKVVTKEIDKSDEDYAYELFLKLCDPDVMKAEADRLLREVASEYGDIPFISSRQRGLENLLKDPKATRVGKPLTDADRQAIRKILDRKRTLGESAEGRLDEMYNLVVGKPAPEIVGVDFDGKPLKLSDYRGKVVVLVFWGSWCGPCMREVPHERELVERMKGKPFALLGINCDEDKAAAVKAMTTERMTWSNWHDGAPGEGPIVKRYHIRAFPSAFVLDGEGIIRSRAHGGEALDKAVDDLLKDLKPTTQAEHRP